MPERLQKILAAAGLASRRKCELLIRAGRVTVDGVIAGIGDQADTSSQRVCVDGVPVVKPKRNVYIALNKPRGYICTLSDPHQDSSRLVTALVALPGSQHMLRPVGRLDMSSEGLVFLTDDGEFIQRLTHPRYHVDKCYLATVKGTPDAADLAGLCAGVHIDGGPLARALSAHVLKTFADTDTCDVEVVLEEGRNRQVRKMLDAIGHPVLRLIRTRIGPITLRGLPSAGWRHLTPTECDRLTADRSAPGEAPAHDRSYQRYQKPRQERQS